jgi:hypothetical protein
MLFSGITSMGSNPVSLWCVTGKSVARLERQPSTSQRTYWSIPGALGPGRDRRAE